MQVHVAGVSLIPSPIRVHAAGVVSAGRSLPSGDALYVVRRRKSMAGIRSKRFSVARITLALAAAVSATAPTFAAAEQVAEGVRFATLEQWRLAPGNNASGFPV